jgi:osmoprotectant transport system substrate-binding protein
MKLTLRRAAAAVAVLGLVLTACGGDDDTPDPAGTDGTEGTAAPTEPGDDGVPADGPTITVGSFNFAESQILGNIYAIALEDAGYPVETRLDLGSREVILPELESGNIDLLPEYVGSALQVGFGGEPSGDLDESVTALEGEFEALGVTVLEPAPGEDKNAFVVTQEFADTNSVTSVADLANVEGGITFGGPPECEQRTTCLLALTDVYGIEGVTFEAIQEGSVRVASLKNGSIDVALLFSTQPVIAVENFIALEEPEGAIPVENIVPVVSDEIIEAYGDAFVDLVNSISELITTEVLIELNGKVELEAEDADAVARTWLEDNGLLS